jgi:hypothetical protein
MIALPVDLAGFVASGRHTVTKKSGGGVGGKVGTQRATKESVVTAILD